MEVCWDICFGEFDLFFFNSAHYKLKKNILAVRSFSAFMLVKLCCGFARLHLTLKTFIFQAS